METAAPPFLLGIATADITPPVGTPMAAFPAGPNRTARVTTSIRDPLLVQVLALKAGDSALILASCDLCGIRLPEVDRIRARVRELAPELGSATILIAATHTHATFDSLFLFCWTPEHPWIQVLVERTAQAIVEAWRQLDSVQLHLATIEHAANANRRVLQADGTSRMVLEHQPGLTTGPTDPTLTLLMAAALDGRPVAHLVHYTAHAITLGPPTRAFSADWPGEVRRQMVDAFPGSTCLFVNGAAGNLHPHVCMRADDEALLATATGVATAAIAASTSRKPLAASIRGLTERLTFTNRHDSALTVEVEITCTMLGELLIIALPGEFFVEYQLELKRRFAPAPVLVIGYCNGWPGYIPTPAAYAEGGYGVDLHDADPPAISRTALPADAGPTIIEHIVQLAIRLEMPPSAHERPHA